MLAPKLTPCFWSIFTDFQNEAFNSNLNHGVPFVIKTIRITSKVRLHCNKTRSVRPITILITNQTKPHIDLTCFDCFPETETALDSLAGNRTQQVQNSLKWKCKQIKSNENEITTHLNGLIQILISPLNISQIKRFMVQNFSWLIVNRTQFQLWKSKIMFSCCAPLTSEPFFDSLGIFETSDIEIWKRCALCLVLRELCIHRLKTMKYIQVCSLTQDIWQALVFADILSKLENIINRK